MVEDVHRRLAHKLDEIQVDFQRQKAAVSWGFLQDLTLEEVEGAEHVARNTGLDLSMVKVILKKMVERGLIRAPRGRENNVSSVLCSLWWESTKPNWTGLMNEIRLTEERSMNEQICWKRYSLALVLLFDGEHARAYSYS